jgi:hypothetical protein
MIELGMFKKNRSGAHFDYGTAGVAYLYQMDYDGTRVGYTPMNGELSTRDAREVWMVRIREAVRRNQVR